MITLIIALLCFLILFSLCCFIPLKQNKTTIMAGIVLLMLILTIVDQFLIPKYPLSKLQSPQHFTLKPLPPSLMLNTSTELYKNTPSRPLLKQQRTLLSYLLEKQQNKQNIVEFVKNIDNVRWRAIMKEFQAQTGAPAFYVDFKQYEYRYGDIESAVLGAEGKGVMRLGRRIVYGVVDGLSTWEHSTVLENIFLAYNVSYILMTMPNNLLQMSSLGKWTHCYEFEGNYMAQVLENHPPRLVQLCSKYRTIDYPFYVMSQSEPLSELCTKLPSNSVTECIRKFMQKAEDRIPFSRVRKCFTNQNPNPSQNQGVIYENGMIGLKKDYFYAGKVDRSLFSVDSMHPRNENL